MMDLKDLILIYNYIGSYGPADGGAPSTPSRYSFGAPTALETITGKILAVAGQYDQTGFAIATEDGIWVGTDTINPVKISGPTGTVKSIASSSPIKSFLTLTTEGLFFTHFEFGTTTLVENVGTVAKISADTPSTRWIVSNTSNQVFHGFDAYVNAEITGITGTVVDIDSTFAADGNFDFVVATTDGVWTSNNNLDAVKVSTDQAKDIAMATLKDYAYLTSTELVHHVGEARTADLSSRVDHIGGNVYNDSGFVATASGFKTLKVEDWGGFISNPIPEITGDFVYSYDNKANSGDGAFIATTDGYFHLQYGTVYPIYGIEGDFISFSALGTNALTGNGYAVHTTEGVYVSSQMGINQVYSSMQGQIRSIAASSDVSSYGVVIHTNSGLFFSTGMPAQPFMDAPMSVYAVAQGEYSTVAFSDEIQHFFNSELSSSRPNPITGELIKVELFGHIQTTVIVLTTDGVWYVDQQREVEIAVTGTPIAVAGRQIDFIDRLFVVATTDGLFYVDQDFIVHPVPALAGKTIVEVSGNVNKLGGYTVSTTDGLYVGQATVAVKVNDIAPNKVYSRAPMINREGYTFADGNVVHFGFGYLDARTPAVGTKKVEALSRGYLVEYEG
jgi:hypothetical protein